MVDRIKQTYDRLDARITGSLARIAVPTLRIGLGVVFLVLIGAAMAVGATVRGGRLVPEAPVS